MPAHIDDSKLTWHPKDLPSYVPDWFKDNYHDRWIPAGPKQSFTCMNRSRETVYRNFLLMNVTQSGRFINHMRYKDPIRWAEFSEKTEPVHSFNLFCHCASIHGHRGLALHQDQQCAIEMARAMLFERFVNISFDWNVICLHQDETFRVYGQKMSLELLETWVKSMWYNYCAKKFQERNTPGQLPHWYHCCCYILISLTQPTNKNPTVQLTLRHFVFTL